MAIWDEYTGAWLPCPKVSGEVRACPGCAGEVEAGSRRREEGEGVGVAQVPGPHMHHLPMHLQLLRRGKGHKAVPAVHFVTQVVVLPADRDAAEGARMEGRHNALFPCAAARGLGAGVRRTPLVPEVRRVDLGAGKVAEAAQLLADVAHEVGGAHVLVQLVVPKVVQLAELALGVAGHVLHQALAVVGLQLRRELPMRLWTTRCHRAPMPSNDARQWRQPMSSEGA